MSDIRTLTAGEDYEFGSTSPCFPHTPSFVASVSTFGPAIVFVAGTAVITSGVGPPGMIPYVCTDGASSTLQMIGVPYAPGVYTFTLDGTLSNASHFTVDCVWTVALSGSCPLITPSDANLIGRVGIAYSRTITATGGVAPYTWDVIGTLPPGLSFSSGGVFSGTPTTAGTYTFTLRATDANGCKGAKPYVMVIALSRRTQIRGETQIKPESTYDGQLANTADIKHRKLQGGAIPYIVPDVIHEDLPWVPGSVGGGAGGNILADGTIAFTNDQSMGNHKLTNVKDGVAAQDAINVRQAEGISVLTNGDATTPEIMFDATGDVIMTGI